MCNTHHDTNTQSLTQDTAKTAPTTPSRRRSTPRTVPVATRALREALEPYVDLSRLRQLAANGADLQAALSSGDIPDDVAALISFASELLRPTHRDQIKSPGDAAAFLMVRMGLLDQEELWVICLNTRNRVLSSQRVYKGSLDTSVVRVGELFREAIRRNASSILVAHNHPSGQVDPSPEDILITRRIIEAGTMLDINVVDHLIVGRGQWLSLREKGLAFTKS